MIEYGLILAGSMMTAISRTKSQPTEHLRPFDLNRDLNAVANLVEQCFAETLDPDGRRYIQHMRLAARNPRYLRWASLMAGSISMPLTGFVWEDNGFLAGNLSLIPFLRQGKRIYLIANVAVDPNYRRRGIARSMTMAALDNLKKRGAKAVWLQVREDNPIALNLYRSLGFQEQTRRTTWEVRERTSGYHLDEPELLLSGVRIIAREARFWPKQLAWLQALYPPEVIWYFPFNLSLLRPGIWGSLMRLFHDAPIRQWAAIRGDQLLGILAYNPAPNYADHLWLAAPPEYEDTAVRTLLHHVRLHHNRRPLSIDFPAEHSVQAFQETGFYIHQTLVWMEIKFRD